LTYGRNGDLYALVGVGGPYDLGMPIIGAASPPRPSSASSPELLPPPC
jgi:hypothetical protein